MATRFNTNAQSTTRLGQPGLPSGYKSKSALADLTVPPVGIDDVDRALFNLLNEEIPFTVGGDGTELKRVPVVFAAGEKWALFKRMRALRDRNNTLILPLITCVRNQVIQAPDSDITGRGINQQTGEIVVRRKLDNSDRSYQDLVNSLLVQNGSDVAYNLVPNLDNNVFETLVVPAPQFFTAQYDVTFWTQYTKHMNQLIEQLIASFLPQGNAWRLDTPKGYWFVATVDANTYTSDSNLDDFSQEERVVKYKFVIKVPGYVLATNVPGAPVPLKRYVSAPSIDFTLGLGADDLSMGGTPGPTVPDPFLGADDPTLPIDPGDTTIEQPRADQRWTDGTRLYPSADSTNPDDPAVTKLPRGTKPARYLKITGTDNTGQQVTRYVRVKNVNPSTGEMALSSDLSLGGMTIELVE